MHALEQEKVQFAVIRLGALSFAFIHTSLHRATFVDRLTAYSRAR